MSVLVISSSKKPLMPCHPARARELMRKGRAAVFRVAPFTIILNDRANGEVQPLELKVDPGSKKTGVALVAECQRGRKVVFAAEIEHRGEAVKKSLSQRRGIRRSRRNRHARYRAPRFQNRTRATGWLPPSLVSRVENIHTWGRRISRLSPVSAIAVETVRFDTQLMQNPEISGTQYQQGELAGYECREYLLEKFDRTCVYCDAQNVPLEVEHIVPRSRGGSNRISNLAIACRTCNQDKGSKSLDEFLSGNSVRIKRIKARLLAPLRDAAAVNSTRRKVGDVLSDLGFPISFCTGGKTKFNRTKQGYGKAHWLDAACVGRTGLEVYVPNWLVSLNIVATGHGDRQACLVDRHGFPRSKPSVSGAVHGFRTGDMVTALVTTGKKAGRYYGRVAVRASGNFNIKTKGETVQGINHRYCHKVMAKDGYLYAVGQPALAFLPSLKARVSSEVGG